MLETLLSVVQVFICIVLIFLVLMHSGKDAGLSGAFGVGSGQGPLGGGSLVERNLNRWTIAFAILFAVNTIVLIKKPRQGGPALKPTPDGPTYSGVNPLRLVPLGVRLAAAFAVLATALLVVGLVGVGAGRPL